MAVYYWIDDSGDWNDPAHWSLTSGGVPNPSLFTPTNLDDAIFDSNSFSADGIVTTDVSMGQIGLIDFSGITFNVTLDGASTQILAVRGLTLSDKLTIDLSSFQIQVGDIFLAGLGTPSPLVLDFAGATFTSDPVLVVMRMVFQSGELRSPIDINFPNCEFTILGHNAWTSNGISITCEHFRLIESDVADSDNLSVDLGNSIIDVTPDSSGRGVILGDKTHHRVILNAENASVTLHANFNSVFQYFNIAGGNGLGSMTILGDSDITVIDLTDPTAATPIPVSPVDPIHTFTIGAPVIASSRTVTFTADGNIPLGNFSTNGTPGHLINLRSTLNTIRTTITADLASVSYLDVKDNIAAGMGILFDDTLGGVDSGNNLNWLFPTNANELLQIVTLVASDPNGDVQTINAGKSDDGTPIYYELETQELEFGNRGHFKKISDKLTVVTQNGQDSMLQAQENDGNYKEVPMKLDEPVSIGKDIDLGGNYFTFRWSGQVKNSTPVLEEIYIEDIEDQGITYG